MTNTEDAKTDECILYILNTVSEMLPRNRTRDNIVKIMFRASKRYRLKTLLRFPDILKYIDEHDIFKELRDHFLKKPSRTGSGVVPVAVMIKPEDSCKHACIYCPYTGKAAKSYTGYEPASLRARANKFDPFMQVMARLRQYREIGHDTTKCEIIVMGGTFLETDAAYKRWFIKSIYDALNYSTYRKASKSLEEAKVLNEQALNRCVGLTIETRPDVCNKWYVNEALSYGCTRVELGVQHPDDNVYALINRGHNVGDVVSATRDLREAGLKVLYHIMLGLPGSDPKKDIRMIKHLFDDPRFKPDMIKIYPTLLIKGTKLYEMYEAGEYMPYSDDIAADIISEAYRYIPEYVRVMRVQRDIPRQYIYKGVEKSNLREIVANRTRSKGINVMEIRDREVGKRGVISTDDFRVRVLKYTTSSGTEYFISYVGRHNEIAGFVRLSIPSCSWKLLELNLGNVAFIRELHVYGREMPLGAKGVVQHRGIGSKLLREAENVAKDEGIKHLLITSGVGVREYYRKRGYSILSTYMHKALDNS